MDYKKWDRIAAEQSDDDDDDEPNPGLTVDSALKASQDNPEASVALLNQQSAYMTLLAWLREAAEDLSETDVTNVARLVAAQDKVTCPDEKPRRDAIIDFLDEKKAWTVPFKAVVGLCRKAEVKTRAQEEGASRVLILAMDTLNLLAACRAEGGAQKLFETMDCEPEVATQYKAYMYAQKWVTAAAADSAPAEDGFDMTEVEATLPPFPKTTRMKKGFEPHAGGQTASWLRDNHWNIQGVVVAFAFACKWFYDYWYDR